MKEDITIKTHIAKKQKVKEQMITLWEHITELDSNVGLSKSTMMELQAKISSKIAQCDRSIIEHEKLL